VNYRTVNFTGLKIIFYGTFWVAAVFPIRFFQNISDWLEISVSRNPVGHLPNSLRSVDLDFGVKLICVGFTDMLVM
jgi:hypothetical protein